MRFIFTMNMASRAGNPVHQILGDADNCDSLSDVAEILAENDFIIVEEIYRDDHNLLRPAGKIMLNRAHIGKVKEYV